MTGFRASASPRLAAAVRSILARPWLDAVALPSIANWLFPLSRAWAACAVPGATAQSVREGLPDLLPAGPALEKLLARMRRARAIYEQAEGAWCDAFLEGQGGDLAAIERERARAAHQWMAQRVLFLPAHMKRRLPGIAWDLASAETVSAWHGQRLADPSKAFPARNPAEVRRTPAFRQGEAEISWISVPSSVGGARDRAWARVIEPVGVINPPTLVFLHGIGMESEFWRHKPGPIERLVQNGIRVIRPEAPFHGRRRLEGYFGGEPIIARGPLGMMDAFEAWVGEAAAWMGWAHAMGSPRVGLGGLSLGGLASQLAASAAPQWPADCRPDALMLVATSGDVVSAGSGGSLARALGIPEKLIEAGWAPSDLAHWAPLLQPTGLPEIDPADMVLIYGALDTVMPLQGGLDLARRWSVPETNVFIRPQGHFSLALGLTDQPAPLQRMLAVLKGE